MKKAEYPTRFQQLFFDQLEALTAASMSELVEAARQQGIPRECAKAFWITRRKETAKRPAAISARDESSLRKPKPAA